MYRSVVFTDDGKIWTHGVTFNTLTSAPTLTLSSGQLSVTLAGLTSNTVDVLTSVTNTDSYLTASTSGGAITISHKTKSGLPTTSVGSSTLIPQITVDSAGHITALTTVTGDLYKVT
jgi:hypothetical protein